MNVAAADLMERHIGAGHNSDAALVAAELGMANWRIVVEEVVHSLHILTLEVRGRVHTLNAELEALALVVWAER